MDPLKTSFLISFLCPSSFSRRTLSLSLPLSLSLSHFSLVYLSFSYHLVYTLQYVQCALRSVFLSPSDARHCIHAPQPREENRKASSLSLSLYLYVSLARLRSEEQQECVGRPFLAHYATAWFCVCLSSKVGCVLKLPPPSLLLLYAAAAF